MKKTNRIRIFFIFTAILVCAAYGMGYHYMNPGNAPQDLLFAKEEPENIEEETSIESANMTLPYQYLVIAEDGYLNVYMDDKQTLYMYTDIKLEELPLETAQKVSKGLTFKTLEDLYRFLEAYSS